MRMIIVTRDEEAEAEEEDSFRIPDSIPEKKKKGSDENALSSKHSIGQERPTDKSSRSLQISGFSM